MNIQSVKYRKETFKNKDGSTETKKVMIDATLTDGTISSVPLDEANTDYQAIQEWVADGNTIQEAD